MPPISRKTFLQQASVLATLGWTRPWTLGQEALPRVLILGDSISIGYTPFVKELLADKAFIYRPLLADGKDENCAGTTHGLTRIDAWIGEESWDLVHFNFGLHDLKQVDPLTGENSKNPDDPQQAPLKQYKKNLLRIVKKLEATKAKLIFATTTPYPDITTGPLRKPGQAALYNEVALQIMHKRNIPIDDLHAYVLPQMAALQRPENVHFTEYGSRQLAAQVASAIQKALSL